MQIRAQAVPAPEVEEGLVSYQPFQMGSPMPYFQPQPIYIQQPAPPAPPAAAPQYIRESFFQRHPVVSIMAGVWLGVFTLPIVRMGFERLSLMAVSAITSTVSSAAGSMAATMREAAMSQMQDEITQSQEHFMSQIREESQSQIESMVAAQIEANMQAEAESQSENLDLTQFYSHNIQA